MCACKEKKSLYGKDLEIIVWRGGGVLKDEIYGSYSIVRPTTR